MARLGLALPYLTASEGLAAYLGRARGEWLIAGEGARRWVVSAEKPQCRLPQK